MNVSLRAATPADFTQMCAVSSRAHLAPIYKTFIPPDEYPAFLRRYTLTPKIERQALERYDAWYSDSSWQMCVAEEDGVLCGFTVAQHTEEGLELRGLFVDPSYQSQGIGKKLFQESLSWRQPGETVRLIVIEKNAKAQQLYRSHGFVIVGVVAQRFYGASQIAMELT